MKDDLFPLDKFTDSVVAEAYKSAISKRKAATDDAALVQLKVRADKSREEALGRASLLRAAMTYLDFAQAEKTVDDIDPEKFFHFAANASRDLGLLQHAAECYFNAALCGYRRYLPSGEGDPGFIRRSAGHAKAMFSELGDDENSNHAHVLQQKTLLAEYRHSKSYALRLIYATWDIISLFGTSPIRWLRSLSIVVVSFAVIYPLLIVAGYSVPAPEVCHTGSGLFSSSLYFSIGNLLQFGTLGTLTPKSGWAQLVAIAHGIAAFVLVGTGATFLTRR